MSAGSPPPAAAELRAAIESTASDSPDRVALADPEEERTYGELAELLARAGGRPASGRGAHRVSPSVGDVEQVLADACGGRSMLTLDAGATECELERAGSLFSAAAQGDEAAPGPVLGLCTSGSSGLPKVVELDWEGLLDNAGSFAKAAAYGPTDVLWCTTPLAHLYCLGAGVLAGLLSGATVLLGVGVLAPDELARIVATRRPTVLLSVPFLFQRYLGMLRAEPRITASLDLRVAIAAGEPVPPSLIEAWRELTGTDLLAHYGLTEGGQITLAKRGDDEGVGLPLDGVEVMIDDRGQVLVRRSPPARLYRVIGEEASADGWYATRDLGRLDERGNLHIEGRADSRINVAGKKVDPAEVEEALGACEGVADCAVASHEAPGGNQVVAFLCVEEGAEPDDGELRANLAERLSPYKLPRSFVRVAEIPRTLTGKIRRGKLIAGLSAGAAEGPSPATMLELVRAETARVALGHSTAGSIDPDRSFKGTGFDSILAVELSNRLSQVTGLRLPEAVIFDHPTPRRLAEFLLVQAGGTESAPQSIEAEVGRIERFLASLGERERIEAIMRMRSLLQTISPHSDTADVDAPSDIDLASASDDEVIELIDVEFGSA